MLLLIQINLLLQLIDSSKFLPPPTEGSVLFSNDEQQYKLGKEQRKSARGILAKEDCDLSVEHFAKTFSKPFGITISKENTPYIYEMLTKLVNESGSATSVAKKYFARTRPFAYYHEDTCDLDSQKTINTQRSYPSGHTAIGWTIALVLLEINPERQFEIMTRGFEIGESRVICGFHWQSDVDQGRIISSIYVARIHADTKYNTLIQLAKEEFLGLNKF